MKGKLSEGLDLPDEGVRLVIAIGIPLSSLGSADVLLKMNTLWDKKLQKNSFEHRKSHLHLTGENWYTIEGIKAVNQAIGRGIRHVKDFCAIVLIDQRFSFDDNYQHLPMWIRK